ncbi:hypothetical protein Y032_0001g110 [Ancylostoma ceylanicum]|nr:hypothetical protein Y032_0001g110 [Ancylostoma ceylanicum]
MDVYVLNVPDSAALGGAMLARYELICFSVLCTVVVLLRILQGLTSKMRISVGGAFNGSTLDSGLLCCNASYLSYLQSVRQGRSNYEIN